MIDRQISMSKFIYLMPLWCEEYLVKPLQVVQNKAARLIAKLSIFVPYYSPNLLPLDIRLEKNLPNFVKRLKGGYKLSFLFFSLYCTAHQHPVKKASAQRHGQPAPDI